MSSSSSSSEEEEKTPHDETDRSVIVATNGDEPVTTTITTTTASTTTTTTTTTTSDEDATEKDDNDLTVSDNKDTTTDKNPSDKETADSDVDGESDDDDDVTALTQQVATQLSLETQQDASFTVKKNNLATLASWISASRRILVLSGAGVSVAAGIPDFRTPGTGLYDNLQKYNLPFPQAVFDLEFYRHNPRPFCRLAQELWPGLPSRPPSAAAAATAAFRPTLTHSFVTLLARKKKLLRNYTQNIDGLEYLAQLSTEYLVECHGHFRAASCIDCHATADATAVRQTIQDGQVPQCGACGSWVKPDIVFFGQGLPDRFHQLLRTDRHQTDLVLVLGTSLQVAPVSLIPEMVSCRRALINRDLVGVFQETCGGDSKNDRTGSSSSSSDNNNNNKRDVYCAGDCDDAVLQLARLLDWQEELQDMHRAVQAAGADS